MEFSIIHANLEDEALVGGIVDVLDSYAREPAGGSAPLADDVRERLIADLRHVDNAVVLAAVDAVGKVVGIVICFRAYSSFKAAPLINIHDIAVLPDHRGMGIGTALLAALEEKARAEGCCKLTLEVLDDNFGARRLYEAVGVADRGPREAETKKQLMQKPL
ncbi:MAG: GNAT family N-acetyltransferase [Gammaproteobacteria bacterium]